MQPLELVVLAGASSMEFGVHTASGAAIRCKIKHGDFPSIFVCLPEGITPWNHRPIFWQIQNWNISGTWMGIAFSEWLNYYLVSSPLANLDDIPLSMIKFMIYYQRKLGSNLSSYGQIEL